MQENNKQIQLEIDPETANGKYSNLVVVNHSATEFVLDFVSVMPGLAKSKVHSRVILTPEHAKRLLHALQENISKFENSQHAPDANDLYKISFDPKGEA